MEYITKLGFNNAVQLHKKWLGGKEGGKRMSFKNVCFYNMCDDIEDIDLEGAKFEYCTFKEISFTKVNFTKAVFTSVNFENCLFNKCDFRYAFIFSSQARESYLKECDFYLSSFERNFIKESTFEKTDLSYSDMEFTIYFHCDFINCNFNQAYMRMTNLTESSFEKCKINPKDAIGTNFAFTKLDAQNEIQINRYDETTTFLNLQCPEKGGYTAFKAAHGFIVKLYIPADALRSSATSRKCRASKAKVVSITTTDGRTHLEEVQSDYDPNFVYRVGETVEVKDFDTNRWNECSTGIHHFLTRKEAENYMKM